MDIRDETIRFDPPETKRKKILFSILGIIVFCVIGVVVVNVYHRVSGTPSVPVGSQPTPTPDPMAPKQVLLLGYGGINHDGGLLTDTMIVARIVPKEKKVILISIPRDLWVPVEVNVGTSSGFKINAVYAIGSDDKAYPNKPKQYQGNNGGIRMAKDTVGKVTGLTIDWAVAIDFSGFTKLMSTLGGIFVDVPFSFEDTLYPLEGKEKEPCGKSEEDIQKTMATLSGQLLEEQFPCRYETLKFEKGKQFMDGVTALKFVRSRHSNVNGGDFGRSLRQQAFIQGVKNRVLSFSGATKIISLVQDGLKMVDTDITVQDVSRMVELYGNISSYTFDSIPLTDQTVLEFSMSPDGQSILVPKAGVDDWQSISQYIKEESLRITEATPSGVVQ